MKKPLIPLLLTLIVLTASAVAGAEPHAPIVITGDGTLLVPDALSGNGVRRGTGTALDPYVISGWEIEAPPNGTAISIDLTTAHVRIENVRVVTPQEGWSRAFAIGRSQNVEIVALTVDGGGALGTTYESTVAMSNVRINTRFVDQDPDTAHCLYAEASRIVMRDVAVIDVCGLRETFKIRGDSRIDAQNVHVAKANVGFGVKYGAHLTLDGADVAAATEGDMPTGNIALVGHRGVYANLTDGGGLTLRNVTFRGFEVCVEVGGAEARRLPPNTFDSVRFEDCKEESNWNRPYRPPPTPEVVQTVPGGSLLVVLATLAVVARRWSS